MKKLVVVVLVIALVIVCFAGCSAGGKKGGEKVEIGEYTFKVDTKKDPADLEIAVVYMNVTAPFAQAIKQGVDAAAEDFGVNAYMTGKDTWDTAEEVDIVQNLIAKGVDGIAVAVMDEPGMTPVIQEALEAGIPIITFNVDAPDSGRLGFVGANLYEQGSLVAKDVCEAMGGKGKILMSSVAQSSTWSRQRQSGAEDVIAEYPDIEVVQLVDCPGSEDDQYGALENALLANPDINGHVSLGGTAYVFARVLKENEVGCIDSDAPIYNSGFDLTPAEEVLDQIVEGYDYTMYTQNPVDQGYISVEMLANFLTTADPASFSIYDTPNTAVSRDNAQTYIDMLKNGEPVG